MWILLKLGVSIKYARYFRVRLHEYHIEEMHLRINSTNIDMSFIASGYLLERHISFFEKLNYDKKIVIV